MNKDIEFTKGYSESTNPSNGWMSSEVNQEDEGSKRRKEMMPMKTMWCGTLGIRINGLCGHKYCIFWKGKVQYNGQGKKC